MRETRASTGTAAHEAAPICKSGVSYFTILERVMKTAGITRRQLARDGVISDRGRKTLEMRIITGAISKGEYDRLNVYLSIDPLKLHMAIIVYNDAESYFDQSTEIAASYSHEMGLRFRENEAARDGNLGTIGSNLIRAHADRLSAEFSRHMDHVDRFREAPLR